MRASVLLVSSLLFFSSTAIEVELPRALRLAVKAHQRLLSVLEEDTVPTAENIPHPPDPNENVTCSHKVEGVTLGGVCDPSSCTELCKNDVNLFSTEMFGALRPVFGTMCLPDPTSKSLVFTCQRVWSGEEGDPCINDIQCPDDSFCAGVHGTPAFGLTGWCSKLSRDGEDCNLRNSTYLRGLVPDREVPPQDGSDDDGVPEPPTQRLEKRCSMGLVCKSMQSGDLMGKCSPLLPVGGNCSDAVGQRRSMWCGEDSWANITANGQGVPQCVCAARIAVNQKCCSGWGCAPCAAGSHCSDVFQNGDMICLDTQNPRNGLRCRDSSDCPAPPSDNMCGHAPPQQCLPSFATNGSSVCSDPHPVNEWCEADYNCQDDLWCNATRCAPLSPIGGPCMMSRHCQDLSAFCMEGKCSAPLKLGETCRMDSQCEGNPNGPIVNDQPGNFCFSNGTSDEQCSPRSPLGGPCDYAPHCLDYSDSSDTSVDCEQHTCIVWRHPEESCGAPHEMCLWSQCVEGFCVAAVPQSLPSKLTGSPCQNDSNCDAEFGLVCFNGVCDGNVTQDGACDSTVPKAPTSGMNTLKCRGNLVCTFPNVFESRKQQGVCKPLDLSSFCMNDDDCGDEYEGTPNGAPVNPSASKYECNVDEMRVPSSVNKSAMIWKGKCRLPFSLDAGARASMPQFCMPWLGWEQGNAHLAFSQCIEVNNVVFRSLNRDCNDVLSRGAELSHPGDCNRLCMTIAEGAKLLSTSGEGWSHRCECKGADSDASRCVIEAPCDDSPSGFWQWDAGKRPSRCDAPADDADSRGNKRAHAKRSTRMSMLNQLSPTRLEIKAILAEKKAAWKQHVSEMAAKREADQRHERSASTFLKRAAENFARVERVKAPTARVYNQIASVKQHFSRFHVPVAEQSQKAGKKSARSRKASTLAGDCPIPDLSPFWESQYANATCEKVDMCNITTPEEAKAAALKAFCCLAMAYPDWFQVGEECGVVERPPPECSTEPVYKCPREIAQACHHSEQDGGDCSGYPRCPATRAELLSAGCFEVDEHEMPVVGVTLEHGWERAFLAVRGLTGGDDGTDQYLPPVCDLQRTLFPRPAEPLNMHMVKPAV